MPDRLPGSPHVGGVPRSRPTLLPVVRSCGVERTGQRDGHRWSSKSRHSTRKDRLVSTLELMLVVLISAAVSILLGYWGTR